jgi:membrane protein DedA with SNARE-associated domain
MPPTWMVLAFFQTTNNLNPIFTVILGASFALMGRLTLYYVSTITQSHLPKNMANNYQALGEELGSHKTLSIPLFLLFAFYPLPSNQLFIVAGLSKLNPKLLAISFLGGRILSYSFWVGSANALDKNIETIFREGFEPRSIVGIGITMLLLVVLPGLVPWKKVIEKVKLLVY